MQRVVRLLMEVSMSRLRWIMVLTGIAVFLAGMIHPAAGWFPLKEASELDQKQSDDSDIAAPKRDPIRVSSNVQNAKLIFKVDPICSEQAKAESISGNVTLLVTVNEEGQVWDVRAVGGHLLLVKSAISAVKKWRYSPTFLKGKTCFRYGNLAINLHL